MALAVRAALRRRLSLTALLLLTACSPTRGVPIFLWHSVGEGNLGDPYDLTADEFDRQLDLLDRWGAHPVTLDRLFDALEGKAKLPERAVVLTFDDGRMCQRTEVLPLLAKHHFVAETFVVSSFLRPDAARRFVEHDAHGAHPMLTWPELSQMAASGVFSVESHGRTHRSFHALSAAEQKREVLLSRAELKLGLHRPVDFFSYPFGAFEWGSRNLVEQAGYRAAFSVSKNLSTRFAIHRVSIARDQTPSLEAALRDAYGSPPSTSTKR